MNIKTLTQEQGIIITGFTGTLAVDWEVFQADAKKRLGHPVFTHDFGDQELMAKLKELYRKDFLTMAGSGQMTYQQTVDYLDGLPGVQALFWFMENVDDDHPHRTDLFFYCRERVRRYTAGFNDDTRRAALKDELAFDRKMFMMGLED